MVIKRLKLILNRQILSLFLNAFIFAFLLEVINASRYSLIFVVIFILYAWYLYRKFFSGQENFLYLYLFFILIALSLGIYLNAFGFEWVIFAFFGLLLYLMIGSVRVVFQNYKQIFGFVYYIIIFLISAFMSSKVLDYGALVLLCTFFIYYLTLKEYSVFIIEENNKRISMWALLVAFVASELLWVGSLLSVGPLGVSIIVLVFWVSAIDIFLQFFLGKLSKKNIYNNIIFAIMSFFVAILFILLV